VLILLRGTFILGCGVLILLRGTLILGCGVFILLRGTLILCRRRFESAVLWR
jgi:hypothetical protein